LAGKRRLSLECLLLIDIALPNESPSDYRSARKNRVPQPCGTATPQVGQLNARCSARVKTASCLALIGSATPWQHAKYRPGGEENLKERTMEKRESSRRHWRIAVTVSLLLHAAVVVGLGSLSGRQVACARTGTANRDISFCVVEYDPGEVTFISPRETGPPRYVERKSPASPDHAGSATATLADPLAASASAPTPAEPGSTGHGKPDRPTGATTSFFQVPAHGRRIVYVIDASASMGKNGAMAAACHELLESVKRLPDSARFQIIVYNRNPQCLLPQFSGWLEPTREVVDKVGAALAGLVPEGITEHGPALQKALLLRPDVVFFLTDADDLKVEHLRLVSLLNRGQAVVHAIELNSRNRHRPEMPMQVLARENRGTYQAVDLEP
jgi:hypothetical protein